LDGIICPEMEYSELFPEEISSTEQLMKEQIVFESAIPPCFKAT